MANLTYSDLQSKTYSDLQSKTYAELQAMTYAMTSDSGSGSESSSTVSCSWTEARISAIETTLAQILTKLETLATSSELSGVAAGRTLASLATSSELSNVAAGRTLASLATSSELSALAAGRTLASLATSSELSGVAAGRTLADLATPSDVNSGGSSQTIDVSGLATSSELSALAAGRTLADLATPSDVPTASTISSTVWSESARTLTAAGSSGIATASSLSKVKAVVDEIQAEAEQTLALIANWKLNGSTLTAYDSDGAELGSWTVSKNSDGEIIQVSP